MRVTLTVLCLFTLALFQSTADGATLGVGLSELVVTTTGPDTFNLSLFPGSASYDGDNSGVLGDGTVLDYRLFNSNGSGFDGAGYTDGGGGRVSTATVAFPSVLPFTLDYAQVWQTTDPVGFTTAADFTTDTIGVGQDVQGTVDISGLTLGTLYFIHGTFAEETSAVSLTMSGAGQSDVLAEHSEVRAVGENHIWITRFDFTDAALYDTISYHYTNTDIDGSRGRFAGVILDDSLPLSPADFDMDGDVDIADYTNFIKPNFLTNVTSGLDGDVDSSGFVDLVDFRLWKDARTDLSPLSAGTAVPEPSSVALLVLSFLGFSQARHVRKK